MMTFEPKCMLWKRLGAEIVQEKIQGLSLSEELEFWRKQTEKLKATQQIAKGNLPDKSIRPTSTVIR